MTAEVAPGLTVSIDAAPPASLPPVPNGFGAALGALDISVGSVAPGGSAQVRVTFERSVDLVKKLIGDRWDSFTFDGTTGATLAPDGRSVVLDLVDGGRGDADGSANGTIADPVVPLEANGLQIVTEATPGATPGEPYSLQLHAVGGDPSSNLTWSVIEGALLPGLSLDADGLVSGVPTAAVRAAFPLGARLHVTDGTSEDTRVLFFARLAQTLPDAASGAPLPEGGAVDFVDHVTLDSPSALAYRSDGTLDQASEVGLDAIDRSANYLSPDRSRMVFQWHQAPGEMPGNPLVVIDSDTGATVASLGATDVSAAAARWSPTGAHLLVPDATSSGSTTGWLYETAGWTVVRTFSQFGTGWLRWSDDGSRLFDGAWSGPLWPPPNGPTTTINTLTAPSFTTGPTVTHPVPGCFSTAISVTARLAILCPSGMGDIVTMSATDGSDVRDVFDECTESMTIGCDLLPQDVRFSPSGSHLAWIGSTLTAWDPSNVDAFAKDLVLSTVPDQDGAPTTRLYTGPFDLYLFLGRWR